MLTREWYEKLVHEIHDIEKNQLPSILEQIIEAKEAWDLSENSEFHSAKEKQALLKARVSELKWMVDDVKIIDSIEDAHYDKVSYGSHVTVEMEDGRSYSFDIVWSWEVDPLGEPMKISFNSPVWSAIEWKKIWDIVKVKLINGRQTLKIIKIA